MSESKNILLDYLNKINNHLFLEPVIARIENLNANGDIQEVIEETNIAVDFKELFLHTIFIGLRALIIFTFFVIISATILVIPHVLKRPEEISSFVKSILIGYPIIIAISYVPYKISKNIQENLTATGFILLYNQWQTKLFSTKSKVHEKLHNKIDSVRKTMARQEQLLAKEKSLSGREPVPCFVQGGAGLNFSTGDAILISCRPDSIGLLNLKTEKLLTIPFTQLTLLEINGPGKVDSNLGLSGGGFGVEAAAEGILIASVVNALTSISTINTYLKIGFYESEALLHLKSIEPSQLRIILSPAFAYINNRINENYRSQNTLSVSLSSEIEKLGDLKKIGILSEEEFVAAKKRLLGDY
jgi:hypothetical protein